MLPRGRALPALHYIKGDIGEENLQGRFQFLIEKLRDSVDLLQQYEQRQKNINMAHSEYLVLLAQVLCCEVEDLLENSDSAFTKNRK